ncbi:uncharacterized protein si:dkey-220k22.3 isoform X2 [Labeo rohita]|uniref:uncharacterized protein si:dkey-220k22.3 isoform X2 n=1 Tax=Labeo rohita TaxID=84645 RepID=UPI0021E227D1|nr:uncharacterized protein si:dkey-220k22.3 isoform X2 [Labeo rohita]
MNEGLTYLEQHDVPGCQRIGIVNVSAIENMFRHIAREQVSREYWLLTAREQRDDCLVWEDEWRGYRNGSESILDHTKMSMVIREKGAYLVYIQANFVLRSQNNSNSAVDLKILVGLNGEDMFSAAHDTQMVYGSSTPDAKLNTFLLMKMDSSSKLSVKVRPSNLVNFQPRPFSTFITIIKWADDW